MDLTVPYKHIKYTYQNKPDNHSSATLPLQDFLNSFPETTQIISVMKTGSYNGDFFTEYHYYEIVIKT